MATRAGSEPGWGFGFRPGAGIALGPIGRRLNGRGRWRFFAGVWLLYLLPGFVSAWTEHTGFDRVLRLALLVAFCWVYVDLVARALTGSMLNRKKKNARLFSFLSIDATSNKHGLLFVAGLDLAKEIFDFRIEFQLEEDSIHLQYSLGD